MGVGHFALRFIGHTNNNDDQTRILSYKIFGQWSGRDRTRLWSIWKNCVGAMLLTSESTNEFLIARGSSIKMKDGRGTYGWKLQKLIYGNSIR